MLTGKRLAALLLLSSALATPAVVAAQSSDAPDTPETGDGHTQPDTDAAPEGAEGPEISIPGGGNTIIVTGRRRQDLTRSSSQVVSVLDSAAIARTGEGDIAGALNRVTGLSTVGNGRVFVRGLGDRYSLALLNGLPLPSPEPLSRVVPLDIFPTSVVASSMVQKTFSANFPGEFGGGVINLTTRAIPTESFLTISGGISGDEETTFGPGFTYYGSGSDWTGFDDGNRDMRGALSGFIASGDRINDEGVDQRAILHELGNPDHFLLQQIDDLPVNFSASITGGTAFDVFSDGQFGIIATASISNKWRNRDITSQTAVNAALDIDTDYRDFVTDNRVLANALLGFGLEVGRHKFRLTNLYIRDTLKRAALSEGIDYQTGYDELIQNTGWYERQLFNTQFVGEMKFGDLSVDLRAGYAQTQREAPFEWTFTYARSNNANDPLGDVYLNTLDPQRGGAVVAFSDLTEDLYYGGLDLSYPVADWLGVTVGYAYTDTKRLSTRREFDIRASTGFPDGIGALRPDYLLGPALIDLAFDPEAQAAGGVGPFNFTIFETTQSDPAFKAGLEIHAAYAQAQIEPLSGVSLDLGVRYEDAKQQVNPVQVFTVAGNSSAATDLANDYILPGATLTWEVGDGMQARLSASKTIARPQFRELIYQTYFDPETNRQFNGNPQLVDSQLTNLEARLEHYFGRGSRASVAGFYKDIKNPIEVFSSFSDNEQISGFANAPSARLYGAEAEVQWNHDLYDWDGFFASKQLIAIANYAYTQSKLQVTADDIAHVYPFAPQPATNFFRDGVPLTGQSDHLVNLQLGLEDQDKVQQITLLATYASKRVTSRGTAQLPDIVENPGLRLDLVARQGFKLAGADLELKLEARNLTGRDHYEYQSNGTNRIEINSYNVGRSYAVTLSANF